MSKTLNAFFQPPMSEGRLNIMEKAFKKMDAKGEDVITYKDFERVYSAKEHPKFQNGQCTQEEIVEEFLKHFLGGLPNNEGKVC